MIVHSKNCSRSGASTPPVVTKSAAEGSSSPAPFVPFAFVIPTARRLVDALMKMMPGRLEGMLLLPCYAVRRVHGRTLPFAQPHCQATDKRLLEPRLSSKPRQRACQCDLVLSPAPMVGCVV
jgi:hypothetical protein